MSTAHDKLPDRLGTFRKPCTVFMNTPKPSDPKHKPVTHAATLLYRLEGSTSPRSTMSPRTESCGVWRHGLLFKAVALWGLSGFRTGPPASACGRCGQETVSAVWAVCRDVQTGFRVFKQFCQVEAGSLRFSLSPNLKPNGPKPLLTQAAGVRPGVRSMMRVSQGWWRVIHLRVA